MLANHSLLFEGLAEFSGTPMWVSYLSHWAQLPLPGLGVIIKEVYSKAAEMSLSLHIYNPLVLHLFVLTVWRVSPPPGPTGSLRAVKQLTSFLGSRHNQTFPGTLDSFQGPWNSACLISQLHFWKSTLWKPEERRHVEDASFVVSALITDILCNTVRPFKTLWEAWEVQS